MEKKTYFFRLFVKKTQNYYKKIKIKEEEEEVKPTLNLILPPPQTKKRVHEDLVSRSQTMNKLS
jgi:hypothetical protein